MTRPSLTITRWYRFKRWLEGWSPFYWDQGTWRCLGPIAYVQHLWTRITWKADPYPVKPERLKRVEVRLCVHEPTGVIPAGQACSCEVCRR